jgi:hypothetical protein
MVTKSKIVAYATSFHEYPDQVFSSISESPKEGSTPSTPTIGRLNCVRTTGRVRVTPRRNRDAFSHRTITSLAFGISAKRPHTYRQQVKEKSVHVVRTSPAARKDPDFNLIY